jgi:SRSO17 transposase
MVAASRRELERAGIEAAPETVLADAGYFNSAQITALEEKGIELLVATRSDSGRKRRAQDRGKLPAPPKPARGSVRERMTETLESEEAKRRYRRRGALVEPVFGQIKSNRGCDRFSRRGLAAARSEWRLFAATHNLLRLWRALAEAPTAQLGSATA